MGVVLRPDMEAWLCTYLREELRARGVSVQVGNKEPADLRGPLPEGRALVVVRDDGGSRESHVSFAHQVGVSVLAGSRQRDAFAARVAALVFGLLTDEGLALVEGSPVAGVDWDSCSGPMRVEDDQDLARRYLTVGLVSVGTW